MWLLYRKVLARSALPLAFLIGSSANAAEYYQQPVVSARVETNSNVRLSTDSDDHRQTESYTAQVSDLIGVATPTTNTIVQPTLRYQTFPSDHRFDRFEADLKFNTTYSSPRSDFFAFGRFSRQDAINSELPLATFPEVIPGTPTNTDTGRFTRGLVKNDFFVVPSYSYRLDPRTSIGASATGEITRYSPSDDSSHIDFNYYLAKLLATRALSAKADLTGGLLYSKYDPSEVTSQSHANGVTSGFRYSWSPLIYTSFNATYQRTTIDANDGTQQKLNNWGATLSGGYKTLISDTRLDIGRSVSPSGAGGLYYVDQIHLQYTRDLSERLSVLAATRLQRNGSLSNRNGGDDRRYATVDLSAEYDVSIHWFVRAGYRLISQKYAQEESGADNNQVFLTFGYSGLKRQR